MKQIKKPTVFISYNWTSASTLADKLEAKLDGIAIIRRDKNLESWADLVDFMESIKDQDFAVLFISDESLRSEGCMYEAINLMKKPGWVDATMYVVLDNARGIYRPEGQLPYVKYWNDQAAELSRIIDEYAGRDRFSGAYDSQNEEVRKRQLIHEQIGRFISIVARKKNPSVDVAMLDVVNRVVAARRIMEREFVSTKERKVHENEGLALPVIVLLDTSGSTMGPIIATMKDYLHSLVRELRTISKKSKVMLDFGLVSFSSGAKIITPCLNISEPVIEEGIESLESGGMTDLGAGISTVYGLLAKEYSSRNILAPQLLIITDGIPTDIVFRHTIDTTKIRLMINGDVKYLRDAIKCCIGFVGDYMDKTETETIENEVKEFMASLTPLVCNLNNFSEVFQYFEEKVERDIRGVARLKNVNCMEQ